jgi:hypothetical protein
MDRAPGRIRSLPVQRSLGLVAGFEDISIFWRWLRLAAGHGAPFSRRWSTATNTAALVSAEPRSRRRARKWANRTILRADGGSDRTTDDACAGAASLGTARPRATFASSAIVSPSMLMRGSRRSTQLVNHQVVRPNSSSEAGSGKQQMRSGSRKTATALRVRDHLAARRSAGRPARPRCIGRSCRSCLGAR